MQIFIKIAALQVWWCCSCSCSWFFLSLCVECLYARVFFFYYFFFGIKSADTHNSYEHTVVQGQPVGDFKTRKNKCKNAGVSICWCKRQTKTKIPATRTTATTTKKLHTDLKLIKCQKQEFVFFSHPNVFKQQKEPQYTHLDECALCSVYYTMANLFCSFF